MTAKPIQMDREAEQRFVDLAAETADLQTWDAWGKIHQPFELEWWKSALEQGHSSDEAFFNHWGPIFNFINPRGDVIDIGCGPRPVFIPSTVIDPLALEYQKITPASWWLDVKVIAQPAEIPITGLLGDTIVCWNCIDHTIGWKDILNNMRSYGRPGAKFAVATDFYLPFIGHPGFVRTEFIEEIERRFVITETRELFDRQLALVMIAR
jgi:hypothetical protein